MISRAAFLISIPIAAAAAGSASAQSAPLRVGALPTDGFAEAYYAADMGFFTKAGINAEISSFHNGGEISAAIVGGSLDVGVSSPISLANAYLRGIPLVYIAAGNIYNSAAPTIGFCVAKESPLKSAKEFEGKTISVNGYKDPTHLSVLAWLAKNGADPAKVNVTEVPASETGQALARGTIVGAVIPEPFMSAAISSGDARLFAKCFDAIGNGIMLGGWFTTADWARKNHDVAKRFIGAIYETARWANANHERSGQILQKYSRITDATLHSMTRVAYATTLAPAMINPTLRLAAAYKFTDRVVPGSDVIAKV
ncbi:MAG TPA: ABC transporter substrate-binding protein [Candidatus Acidoferrales bacterium]|nr:ABC transporter substrate-binding protein [Candidatus Acidoferrales bacterium]